MAAIAMIPTPLRASRQCTRLFTSPLGSAPLSQRVWQTSVTEARSFSAITLGSRSRIQAKYDLTKHGREEKSLNQGPAHYERRPAFLAL